MGYSFIQWHSDELTAFCNFTHARLQDGTNARIPRFENLHIYKVGISEPLQRLRDDLRRKHARGSNSEVQRV